MDLDQADAVGELKVEFILEVGCKKQGFEPKIIQIKWVIQEKHLEHLFLFFALRYFSSFWYPVPGTWLGLIITSVVAGFQHLQFHLPLQKVEKRETTRSKSWETNIFDFAFSYGFTTHLLP